MIVQRDLADILKKFIKRREYLAITGPRQAGKTTFLEIIKDFLLHDLKIHKDFIQTVTFEDRRLLSQFESDPVSFVRSYMPAKTSGTFYLMLDEFQYAEEGGQRLKLIFDTVANLKIIITGSSALDIKAQAGKYLVGRILTFHLYPFNFREFLSTRDERLERIYRENNAGLIKWLFDGRPFKFKTGKDAFAEEMTGQFEEYCIWGGYPSVVLSRTKAERRKVLNDIYSNYVLNDIKGLLELATDKNLFLLSQYLAAQTGNIVVYQNLSQVSHLDHRQMKKHLNILDETFICTELRPFFRNRQKELSKNPKIFFYDMGFRNSLVENMNGLAKRSDSGAVLENAVFIRLNELCKGINKLNFWRTKAGAEVDFVLHAGGDIIPVEVKYSKFEREKASRSFTNFVESFNPSRGVVLTRDFRGKMTVAKTEVFLMPVYYL